MERSPKRRTDPIIPIIVVVLLVGLSIWEGVRLHDDRGTGFPWFDLLLSLAIGGLIFAFAVVVLTWSFQARDDNRLIAARARFGGAFVHQYYASGPFVVQLRDAVFELGMPHVTVLARYGFTLVANPSGIRLLTGGREYRTALTLPAGVIGEIAVGSCVDKALTYASVDVQLRTPSGPRVVQLIEVRRYGLSPLRGNESAIAEQVEELRAALSLTAPTPSQSRVARLPRARRPRRGSSGSDAAPGTGASHRERPARH